MKRRSATKPSQPLPDPVFFTDRDLGKTVPRLLAERGLLVERYCDHFAERNVSDNQWLRYICSKGWVGISHDYNIKTDSEAVRTLMENGGRLFVIRGALRAPDLAEVFLAALRQVHGLLRRNPDAAFIASVRRSVTKGGILRAEAQLVLTAEEWRV